MGLLADNPFVGLTLEQLQTLQAQYLTCVTEIATTGQEYILNGRTWRNADLKEAKATLKDVNQALDQLSGTPKGQRTAKPYFHR